MRLLLLFVLFSFAAHAGLLVYQASGNFGPGVPVSFFTAPSESWAFEFTLDDQPVVSNVAPGSFDPDVLSFTYILDGVDLGLAPSITFFDLADDGMFAITFAANNQFSFTGPQMFTGPTSAPQMLAGDFLSVSSAFNYILVGGANVGDLAGTTVHATPEPGTVALAAGGLLALFSVRRRRRSAEID